jgi:hypothetical protein
MTSIVEKILALAVALEDSRLPYAFGGALALAFCTERARGTIDIDVNVFVGRDDARVVLDALPAQVGHTADDLRLLESDGQIRLRWGQTPVDVFLDTTDFHVEAAQRRQRHEFGGRRIPFLGCSDLAVFKAFFNRTKDWADLEEMIAMRALNVDQTIGVLVRYLGERDERVERLRALSAPGDG